MMDYDEVDERRFSRVSRWFIVLHGFSNNPYT